MEEFTMKKRKIIALIIMMALIVCNFPSSKASAAVKLSATSKTLYVGQSTTLKVTGTKKKVKWISTNKKVATVTQKGKVTAKKKGNAAIKARVADSIFKCKIKIKDKEDDKKPSKEETPEQNQEENKIIGVNKLLCEDENISVTFKEMNNGKIILSVKNKSDSDITFGNRYVIINERTYYDDFIVYDIYSATEKEIELGLLDENYNEIAYSFTNGTFSGRVYYYSVDSEGYFTEKNDLMFEIEI